MNTIITTTDLDNLLQGVEHNLLIHDAPNLASFDGIPRFLGKAASALYALEYLRRQARDYCSQTRLGEFASLDHVQEWFAQHEETLETYGELIYGT